MENKQLLSTEQRNEKRLQFIPSAMQSLKTRDKILFEEFGQGPVVELSYQRIHHGFELFAKTQPDQVAVEHFDKSITYDELNRKALRLSQELLKYGVCPGDNVGLFLERSIEMTVGILAILKTEAAYVPQDARITPTVQLRHIVDVTKTQVILTLSHLKHRIPVKDGVRVIAIDNFFKNKRDPLPDNLRAINKADITTAKERLCFVLFTSGTTGHPNGVQVNHENLLNILLTRPGNLGMGPGKKVSQILNISFDMCAWETLGSLCNGATLVIRGKDIQETIKKVDIVIATPSVLGSVNAEQCRNVRVVAVAGEPCPQALADTWSEFASFHNSCGPTETTIVNTVQAYSPVKKELTIGSPTPNNTVYILDENLQPCPIGEIGEMWAGGLCVSNGYVENEALTNERYKPDPFLGNGAMMFRTRDLGRWTRNGELQHFGRTDDQVKIRGFRVELDSISMALESVLGCEQAVTLKLDSQTLAAFVRPLDTNLELCKKAVEALLPYYCTPKVIVPLEVFPKTSRGKIDKTDLTQNAVQKLEELGHYSTNELQGDK